MIGKTVWIFDQNRRVYKPAEPGRLWSSEGPIYREHWRPYVVDGETSRSWLLNAGTRSEIKLPKKRPRDEPGVCYSERELDFRCWEHEHRYKVIDHMRRATLGELIAVARLIGYPTLPKEDP